MKKHSKDIPKISLSIGEGSKKRGLCTCSCEASGPCRIFEEEQVVILQVDHPSARGKH